MAPSKYPLAVTFDSESAMYYSTSSGSPTSFNFEKALACQEDTSTYSRETYPLEIFATHPFPRMTDLRPIKGRLIATLSGMLGILKLVVIYLLSELMIWGCSRVLSLLNAAFFASIVSMVLVAMSITTASLFFPAVGIFYETHVKSEVNFINSHLGVGFTIPLVMLDQNSMLGGLDIVRIMAIFVVTNIIWWPASFVLSSMTLSCLYSALSRSSANTSHPTGGTPLRDLGAYVNKRSNNASQDGAIKNPPLVPQHRVSIDNESLRSRDWNANIWNFLQGYYPLLVSIVCGLVIGAPVAATTGDPRILDACILWFIWYATVKTQLLLKKDTRWKVDPRIKRFCITILNPVLMTTLLTLAYTRLKALMPGTHLARVLKDFSRGTPLYAIWTSSVTGTNLPANPEHFFGAGDLAMSILECGIVLWGFKLYECRQQLFSVAGLFTAVISIGVAAGNVFICATIARGIMLDGPEALAFSARSTTLALAKPAIEAVQGNLAVNAALIVTNGILGQLMYPYLLPRLGAESDATEPGSPATQTISESDNTELQHRQTKRYDTPATIATGIAIGINGIAMGVAYLYETKSRAAPYATLSMTVFGVFTVVFITVDPMRSALIALAS